MKLGPLGALLAGLALSAALLIWAGADQVIGAVLATGIAGVLGVTLFNALLIELRAWRRRSLALAASPQAAD